MIRLIEWRRAQKRHYDRLHCELERDPANNPDYHASDPTARPDIADLAPWSAGESDPDQHQDGAKGNKELIASEDNENGKDSERPKPRRLTATRSLASKGDWPLRRLPAVAGTMFLYSAPPTRFEYRARDCSTPYVKSRRSSVKIFANHQTS